MLALILLAGAATAAPAPLPKRESNSHSWIVKRWHVDIWSVGICSCYQYEFFADGSGRITWGTFGRSRFTWKYEYGLMNIDERHNNARMQYAFPWKLGDYQSKVTSGYYSGLKVGMREWQE